MRTGSRAFNGPTTVATPAAILRDEVPLPITLGFPGPPRLDDLIRRCLQKQPEDRWQAMDEIQAELAILQNYSAAASSISAPSTTAPSSIPAPPSNRPPVHFAGFWIRAAARVIDMVIVGMAMSILRFIVRVHLLQQETFTLAAACLYEVYFVSR